MAAIQSKGECVFGGRQRCRSTKRGDARVGMKKQPVLERKNREVGGSSPEKRKCGVAKTMLAQTAADRDSVRKFWSRDFWILHLCRNSGRLEGISRMEHLLERNRRGIFLRHRNSYRSSRVRILSPYQHRWNPLVRVDSLWNILAVCRLLCLLDCLLSGFGSQ